MRQLKIPVGGYQFWPPADLDWLNQSTVDIATAIAAVLGQNCYLADPVVTVLAGYAACGAGWMTYKGEICQVDAQNTTAVAGQTNLAWVPAITYRITDPVVDADASNQYPHQVKKCVLEWYNPAAPPADCVDIMEAGAFTYNIAGAAWNKIGAAGQPAYYSGDFSNVAGDAGTLQQPCFRKWLSGKVQLRGRMVANPEADISAADGYLAFTLPAGLRPSVTINRPIVAFRALGSPQAVAGWCSITPDGGVRVWFGDEFSPATWVSIDGVEFDTL